MMKVRLLASLAAGTVVVALLAPHVADPTSPRVTGTRLPIRSSPEPSTAPSDRVRLRLRVAHPVVRAGGCVRATVHADGRVPVARITGIDPVPQVKLGDGRGSAELCPPWTSDRSVILRAVAPREASSAPVVLHIRPQAWMVRLDRLLARLPVSVTVGGAAGAAYAHLGEVRRIPASNEKLLLSMAMLDRFGPDATIATTVESGPRAGSTIRGNVWLVGHGDPEVGSSTLMRLAARIRDAGIRRIRGAVIGDTSTFSRERWAPGWRRIALRFIAIPTALTFEGNVGPSGFVPDPELRAAGSFTADLRALGVRVDGQPAAGRVRDRARTIASVRSAPLVEILRRQNVGSLNLDAEVLGKLLGATASGHPGTTAEGASAIQRWAARHGVRILAQDASGLSYRDRISTDGMIRLLAVAARSPWGPALRSTLASPGDGTLAGRLGGVLVRAKTGTLLEGISALAGYVRPTGSRRWLAFSIMSEGLSKDRAVALEDAVVRIVASS
jgi:D-alanyl-D-alanine carboxypeptidase/D-alanyl-D-alanine-endopeptidase (penicillin-binding protein 4)